MNVGALELGLRKSTGKSQNRCVIGVQNALRTAKEPSKELILTRLLKSFMGVFSDDFAAVDVREELCYHSRPERGKFERLTLNG